MATNTPWGPAQSKEKIAKGITVYTTAGHGGIRLSKGRQAQMPEALRLDGGWYEEDCESARVVVAFPDYFSDEMNRLALETLKRWNPDAYEAYFGVTLSEGESLIKDQRIFFQRHKNDLIGIAAIGVGQDMVEVVATPGGQRGSIAKERAFRVPQDEYESRRRQNPLGSFIVDPGRHKEVPHGVLAGE